MSARLSTSDAMKLGLIRGRRHKYGVAEPIDRTYNGRVYASKAEMLYAVELEAMRNIGAIMAFAEQPRVQLGPDTTYRPDFVVITKDSAHFVDVKGKETREFLRIKKLWAKYVRAELRIIKKQGDTFVTVEVA